MPVSYTYKLLLTKETSAAHTAEKFKSAVRQLHNEFKRTIVSPVFIWPSTTHRKNGEIVTSPRNALDLGGLLESQSYKIISNRLAIIEWEAPYTAWIFEHCKEDIVPFTVKRMGKIT